MEDFLNREATIKSVPAVTEFRLESGVMLAGRYRLRAFLGEGGMGRVWLAEEHDGYGKVQEVVVKVVPPSMQADTDEMRRIRQSFELVRRLRHPNITTPLTLAYDAGHGCLLIMDFIDGEPLSKYQKSRPGGKFTLKETVEIIPPLAAALDYAHEQGIIHRDIKPQNVMVPYLARTTRHREVKLIDFDLAAEVFTTMEDVDNQVTATSGTIPYMPPEQLQGQIQGPRSDQYSLAVMAFKMLSGELPFAAPAHNVLTYQIVNQSPRELADVPDFVNQAIIKAMHKMREGRFDTCADFVDALGGMTAPRMLSPHYEIPEYSGELSLETGKPVVEELPAMEEEPVLEMPEPEPQPEPVLPPARPRPVQAENPYPQPHVVLPGARKPLSEVTSADNMDQYLFRNDTAEQGAAVAGQQEMWRQRVESHQKKYDKTIVVEADLVKSWKQYLHCWANSTNMRGRASREEFWSYTIFHYTILFGGWIFLGPFMFLYWLASLLPSLSVTVRRLNDCDVPGGLTFLLIILTPFVFPCFIVLVLVCQQGTRGINSHGPPG